MVFWIRHKQVAYVQLLGENLKQISCKFEQFIRNIFVFITLTFINRPKLILHLTIFFYFADKDVIYVFHT